MNDEGLISAIPRQWVIAISSKPGFPKPISQVLVVSAPSISLAKEKAVKIMQKRPGMKYRTQSCWVFNSISENKAKEENE